MVRRGSTVRVRQRALFSEKYLQIAQFCCHRQDRGAPPCSVGTTIELDVRPAKHLQIELLPSTTEHLRGTEGLGGPGTEDCARKRPESAVFIDRLFMVRRSVWRFGDRSWGQDAVRKKRVLGQDVAVSLARVLSESALSRGHSMRTQCPSRPEPGCCALPLRRARQAPHAAAVRAHHVEIIVAAHP
jgi:hypothetical protein